MVATGPDTDPDPNPNPAPFVLSYVDQSWNLRVRWSEDGTTWTAADAAGNLSIDRAPGLGSNGRVLYLGLFQDAVSDAKFMMGLGPATWDSSPSTVGDGHRGDLDSGPSLVHAAGNNWLVAFVENGQARFRMFDGSTGTRDFGADVTPVVGVVNTGLEDKPALANMDGTVLASWLMGSGQLQMVKGTIQNGVPTWDSPYRFDQNVVENGYSGPVGAHDIATDGERFYAAVVRIRDPLPGEILERQWLFIYTSTNGLNWTRLSFRESMKPLSLSMAARGTDDVLAILSRPAGQFDNETGYRFDGSTWVLMNPGQIFGTQLMNAGHDFTLYAPPE